MKQMQNFHKKMSSKNVALSGRECSLKALTHLNRERVSAIAEADPWFIWGSKTEIEVN